MEKRDLRIVYMGTPEMSARVLEHVIQAGYNVVGVIARIDKPVGRKKIIEKVPTKLTAEKYGIPVFQPLKIRLDYEFVRDLKPDIILTMAYGQIIPKGLLEIPKYLALNLHASILPSYRGAAPIQRAIWNGEKESGVTLMEMVEAMDAGRMFKIRTFPIDINDNFAMVCDKVVDASNKLVDEDIMPIVNGQNLGEVQDETRVTFADKIRPEDEKIDLNKETVNEFINHVRALSPNIGAYLFLNGKKIKFFHAQKYDDVIDRVGKLTVGEKVLLALKDGHAEIKTLQLDGKKIMDASAFKNGYRALDGAILD